MTARQLELLQFLHGRQVAGGAMPSVKEMTVALGLRSTNGPMRLLDALEAQGFVRRAKYCARRVEVLRLPGRAVLSADERDWCEQNAAVVRGLMRQERGMAA